MRNVIALVACSVVVVAACASPPKKQAKRPSPPETAASAEPSTEELEKTILEQTKQTASEQLDCPVDQLIARCTDHDAQGGCTAVDVRGCDKALDYKFGAD